MSSRAVEWTVEVIRYNRRHYITRFVRYTDPLKVGRDIIDHIPPEQIGYKKWLAKQREEYKARENFIEENVCTVPRPDGACLGHLKALPSELPQLDGLNAGYVYVVDLDKEVLTINHGAHFKLDRIPRDGAWRRAICPSVVPGAYTVRPGMVPKGCLASLALRRRRSVEMPFDVADNTLGYEFRLVRPKRTIESDRQAFLSLMAAEVLRGHRNNLVRDAARWEATDMPFRELAHALVFVASGRAEFCNLVQRNYAPGQPSSASNDLQFAGRIDKLWPVCPQPLFGFSSAAHLERERPGVSPPETTYWFEEVVVHVTATVDAVSVAEAASFGLRSDRASFMAVVMSLHYVAFAEVFRRPGGGDPVIQVSFPTQLSPLTPADCVSSHPRNRPALRRGQEPAYNPAVWMDTAPPTWEFLEQGYPGVVRLTRFFEAAGNRRATGNRVAYAPWAYRRVLRFVDHDTWKACALSSRLFRQWCLGKHKLNELSYISPRKFEVMAKYKHGVERMLTLRIKTLGRARAMAPVEFVDTDVADRFMPVVGDGRKALITDAAAHFGSVSVAGNPLPRIVP